jgi:hypothetical protein
MMIVVVVVVVVVVVLVWQQVSINTSFDQHKFLPSLDQIPPPHRTTSYFRTSTMKVILLYDDSDDSEPEDLMNPKPPVVPGVASPPPVAVDPAPAPMMTTAPSIPPPETPADRQQRLESLYSPNKPRTNPQQAPQAPQAHDPRSTQELTRKQKEKFLIFTRVLMKYLEQKDPTLHLQVKDIIRDCAQRNSRKEAGYESVTAAMKRRLKEVVNDTYWERAEVYLEHFLKEKQEGKLSGGRG